jgi:hypothetical protein
MTTKKAATANLTLRRPDSPLTEPDLLAALAPVLELLNLDADDVESLTITKTRVRVVLVPRTRGRRQHDSRVRVSYPVSWGTD